MGGVRRLKKQLAGKPFMVADTGIKFNGCKVLLGTDSPSKAREFSRNFAEFMAFLTFRANQVNMGDLIRGQIEISQRLADGRSLLN